MTHVALTPEQGLLADTVARVVADAAAAPVAVAPSGRIVELGLLGLRLSEQVGGAGAGAVEVGLVVEQLAKGLAMAPYLGPVLALELLAATGPTPEAAGAVREILDGRPAAILLDAGLRGPAADGIALDVGVPAGVEIGVPAGVPPGVDAGVGPAPADAGVDPLVVGLSPDGAVVAASTAEPCDGVDPTRRLARAPGRDAVPLGRIDNRDARARWTALALALLSADLVGTMTGALDAAVGHARIRHQFGRPVGAFQAVAQRCADAAVTVESARSVTWHALWAADALGAAEALHAARVAKAYCAEAGRDVCEAGIQVWGGPGMTWECVAHRYLRRALLDRALLGDERVQLAAIAATRLGEVGAPGPDADGVGLAAHRPEGSGVPLTAGGAL